MKKLLALLSILFSIAGLQAQIVHVYPFLNSDFEYWQENEFPVFWMHPGVTVSSDSVVKLSGNHSLKAVRLPAEVEKSQAPYGLIFQNIASAYDISQLKDNKIEVSVQVKSGARDTSLHVCAFIQLVDPANPANNNIAVGNDAVGDAWMQSSATLALKEVSPATSTVVTGVIMSGCGEIWIDDFRIRVGGEALGEIAPRVTDLTAAEKKWLKKNIVPLSEDGSIDEKRFGKHFSNARIVGVGDNVHGSSSVFRLKNLAAQALIGQQGFTILAIEDSPGVGASFDRFVRGTETTLRKSDMNIMFSNNDFGDFMNWLKAYNGSAGNRVRVFGVDVNSRYKELVEEVKKMTSGRYTTLLDSVFAVLDKTLTAYDPRLNPEKVAFSDDQKKFISESLNTVRQEAPALNPDREQQNLLTYYIDNLLHYLNYSKESREELMAGNIGRLLALYPDAKVIYLAHNQHVCNRNGKAKSTGGWLKERYGNRYEIVGTCYYTGTDLYKQRGLAGQPVINESVRGSYERLFNQLEENGFYLDLKRLRDRKQAAGAWLTEPMLMRNYGVEPFNYYYEFTITDLTQEYDGVLFIRESVPL